MREYIDFLRAKAVVACERGAAVELSELSDRLKPHQRDIAAWAIRGGARAIFGSFGLGKTVMQIQIIAAILQKQGGCGLIVCPLGVKAEFVRDAMTFFGITVRYIRTDAELDAARAEGLTFFVTNYERVRDGDLDPNRFTAVSLDEASVLRSFGSKTYQTFLGLFDRVPFKFVATATPSPNRLKELIHYAGFLGVMDTGQALTRFFKRDSTKAGNLTLHPHKEAEFWLWVSTWAVFIEKPSDLGYSDEGYGLPPLTVHQHRLPVDHGSAGFDSWGQGKLLRSAALGVQDASRERRDSLADRIAKAKEIIDAGEPDQHWIIWHDLEDERAAIEDAFPVAEYDNWQEFKDGNSRGLELYERHYSAYQYKDGRERKLFCGPGFKTVLLTKDKQALFAWRKFRDDSGQVGVNCAVFRNEGAGRASDLIREAMAIAWMRWPGERLYTYVDPRQVKTEVPGYCFIRAGWRRCGTTQGGLLIFEAKANAKVPAVERTEVLRTVYGTQDLDEREQDIADFSDGRYRILATKPIIAGSGCNFQRHCYSAIYLGVGYKFNDWIQSVHRIQRFLQTRPVQIHLIYTESEDPIYDVLMQKWQQHRELVGTMTGIIQRYGLNTGAMQTEMQRAIGIQRAEVRGERFTAVNNDNVLETAQMADNSVDLIVSSWPFSDHYEYCESYNDFGHNDGDAGFFEQMDFLTPNLMRVLKPGRMYCVHAKDRLLFGSVTGYGMYSVNPFSDKCVEHMRKHGFVYCGRITIVTDVVRENNQTYRLGWTEQCKDGTKMGCGSSEYVLLFRKLPTDTSNSYADEPVVKSKADYTRARWQFDAHGMWRSNGNRFLRPEEIANLPMDTLRSLWRQFNATHVYDFREHVDIAEALERAGCLPSSFMALDPVSHSPWVWDDVVRMRTLNTEQARNRVEQHVCPFQIDVVERLIERYSNAGDLVLDPFAGLHTVPYVAVLKGRRGYGVELNTQYWADGVGYCKAAEAKVSAPSLFDMLALEETDAA